MNPPVKRKPRLSHEMAHVLELASQQGTDISWAPLVNGKGSQSRTVGRSLTIEACRRHGWLTWDGKRSHDLTQAGREVLAAYRERQEKRR